MTDEKNLAHEVAELRRELQLHRSSVAASRKSPFSVFVHGFETDPHKQFAVHKWGMYYWLINFPLVVVLFFFEPAVWLKWGIFITLMYSIYANFATDYGAMSAAMAAFGETDASRNDPEGGAS